jgi:hypothetical protein
MPHCEFHPNNRLLLGSYSSLPGIPPHQRLGIPRTPFFANSTEAPLGRRSLLDNLQISDDAMQIQQGLLCLPLHLLKKRKWLATDWGDSESGPQAKFYRLSAKGSKQPVAEKGNLGQAFQGCRPHSANGAIGGSDEPALAGPGSARRVD